MNSKSQRVLLVALIATIVVIIFTYQVSCQSLRPRSKAKSAVVLDDHDHSPEFTAYRFGQLTSPLVYISETDSPTSVFLSDHDSIDIFSADVLLAELNLPSDWPIEERRFDQVMERHMTYSNQTEIWSWTNAFMIETFDDLRFYVLAGYENDCQTPRKRVFIGGLYQGHIIALTACAVET